MKYISLDIETLGLNIDAPIIEVACVFVDNGDIVHQAQTYVTHNAYNNCEPFAMSMHSVILKRIATLEPGFNYVDITWLAHRMHDWCTETKFYPRNGKLTFAGKNVAGFDIPMLDHQTDGAFKMLLNPHHRVLDPGPLFARRGDESVPNLLEIIEQEGLDANVTHTAMDDALAVVAAIERFFDIQEYDSGTLDAWGDAFDAGQ